MAAAVYYTIPLFITLFAALWIREPVGPKGWVAVAIGFGGVLLMLRPEAGDLNIHALLPLGAAILYAVGMIVTRTKVRSENPFVLALIFNLIAIVLGGMASLAGPGTIQPGLFTGAWITMDAWQWALILLLSGTMLIGSVGSAIAYQSGPPSIVATWDFSYLAFAVLWGVALFSERLDPASAAGIALIAFAGIIAIRHRTT